ncbi:hydroxypyruvate isomerase family protein [Neobacillus sp. LXY-4]|uniref:hydroxypyruvate isomerase family protein n=1 Tax=Neobacillus sp. LXY-4 TaxID=3379826 RepID=UPI003EE10D2E
MHSFAANLSTIFTEVPFLERFKKARNSGFSYVECQFPFDVPIEAIKAELNKYELSLVLINFPAGDWGKGERGLAIFPNRRDEFKKSIAIGIEYARSLGVSKLHCLAGVLETGDNRSLARAIYLENLKYAAELMAQENLTLLIEPLNPFDMPGYFLTDIEEAVEIINEIGKPNVKLQLDFYHVQRIQGNLIATYERYFDRIGHIQIADVPGRHQPGTGEIHYERVLKAVFDKCYKGFVGLEYIPLGKSEDSFTWIKQAQLGGMEK